MGALLDALIAASIRGRAIVLLVTAALGALGVLALRDASLDVLPDFTPPRVVVQAEAPGMGTTEVEERVTRPLERVLLGTPETTSVRSSSISGLSITTLTFHDGIEIHRARQLVTERLQLAQDSLPEGVETPQLEPISAPVGALLKLCVTSQQADRRQALRDLRAFAEWTIRPRLSAIPGVAQVMIHGGAVEHVEVRPRPARMRERGVTLDEIHAAVAASQAVSGAGFVDSGEARIDVQAEARFTLDEARQVLENAVVEVTEGTPVRLGDVAEIAIGEEPAVGDAVYDGQPAVFLQVMKLPWGDTLSVTDEVEDALADIARAAPPDLRIEPPVFRQASFVQTSIRSVTRAMLIGSVLVILVLVAFLRSPRLAGISLAAIPLSILAAAAVLVLRGESINGMVLGGLAIAVGVVVDDAIVGVENVWRRLRENASLTEPRPALEVVRSAAQEIRPSIVYATVIICLVLVPVLLLGGIAGRIFAPLAWSYILAILASLAVAVTVTPALCAILLPRVAAAEARPTRFALWLSGSYRRFIRRVVDHPRIVLAGAAALALGGAVLLPFLGGRFLPEFHESSVIAHVNAVPGTSLDETMRLAARVDAQTRPGLVAHVAARAGRAELGEDPFPVNRLEMDLVLAEGEHDWETLVEELGEKIERIPGVAYAVEGFLGERVHEILAGETAPIVVKVIGPDLETLRRVAGEVAEVMAATAGVDSVSPEPQIDVPQIRIRPDASALGRLGLTARQVVEEVATWRQGRSAGQILEPGGRIVDVAVVGAPAARSREAIRDLPISTPDGGWVPLSTLARIEEIPAPAAVNHEQGERRIAIGAGARGGDLSHVAQEIESRVGTTRLPAGYRIEIGGEAAARREASGRLLWVGALVLGGIFIMLAGAFASMKDAAIVLLNFPLGLIGGIAGGLLTPDGLSVAGLVGFVTLFGIIARNGILLVAHKKQLEAERPDDDPVDRVLLAAEERLLPILMTAACAGLGLLPLALSVNAAGSELEAPMALIVCGGLVSSTALNMIVLPTLYVWMARRAARRSSEEASR